MAKHPQLTKEEKAARDDARRSDLAQKLIDAVQAIQTSADFIRMLEWQARLYRYSARNMLLILMQRPDCTQAQSYTTWAKLGRQVKKGAKGIMIYAPRLKKAEKDGDDPSLFFGIEHIFALEDTDGPELAELECPDLDGPGNQAAYARLLAYAAAEGLTVTITPDHPTDAKGYYSATRKLIYIEPASPAQMLRVLAHELAHHGDRDNKVSREEKETIAEGAAHVFCDHFGLDTSASTYPYIAGWAATEGGEKTIMKCLEQIQRIAKAMIQAAETPAEDVTQDSGMRMAA
jgi:hypothetical protein